MRAKIFFFLMFVSVAASAAVTVTPLDVNYNTKTVKFSVSWTGNTANNRVWVWVDLCPLTGTTADAFAQAVISSPSAIAGSIDATSLNGRGFYVTTSPSTVTAVLDNATGNFNWCAYGSDYPPNAIINSSGDYELRGTPPLIINGTYVVSTYTYSGAEITALTDTTGCPGVWCGKDGEAAGLVGCCYGTSNCSGTCKTIGTYTTNDGACTGACNTAYVQLRNQCGDVVDDRFDTTENTECTAGCLVPTCDVCHLWWNVGYAYDLIWLMTDTQPNECWLAKKDLYLPIDGTPVRY
ncbi:MAG: hypothetical protein LBD87_03260 [Prevotellaceae bacterium]|jgi:hypothetical protein|nr:hypothetical protein [Prevotellaceae bacterium]